MLRLSVVTVCFAALCGCTHAELYKSKSSGETLTVCDAVKRIDVLRGKQIRVIGNARPTEEAIVLEDKACPQYQLPIVIPDNFKDRTAADDLISKVWATYLREHPDIYRLDVSGALLKHPDDVPAWELELNKIIDIKKLN